MQISRKLRSFVVMTLVITVLVLTPGAGISTAWAATADFDVAAAAAVLLDVKTGQVLYAKNPDQPIAPASLAKIMTMLLALEDVDEGRVALSDTTQISQKAWELSLRGGQISAMFIEVGAEVTLEDLLYGVGVSSGNDASVAVAEMLAGSEEAFVERMNQRAAQLGLKDTHFVDSHGLSPDARTTAADMARLSAFFVETQHDGLIFANKLEFTYNNIPQPNRNGLLRRDNRVTGLKTGHLGVAGYHLVATAEEGDMSLVAAVLGAQSIADREEVALQLLNYGFRNFRTLYPAWGTGNQKELRVYKGTDAAVAVRPAETVVVTVPVDDADNIILIDELPAYLEAPIEEGAPVGKLLVEAGGKTVAEFELVAAGDVPRGRFFRVILDSIRLFFSGLISQLTR